MRSQRRVENAISHSSVQKEPVISAVHRHRDQHKVVVRVEVSDVRTAVFEVVSFRL